MQTDGVNALDSLEDTINQLQQHGKLSYMKRIRLLVGFLFCSHLLSKYQKPHHKLGGISLLFVFHFLKSGQ